METGVLQLVCPKCTRIRVYIAKDRPSATLEARNDGWKFKNQLTICPKCPA